MTLYDTKAWKLKLRHAMTDLKLDGVFQKTYEGKFDMAISLSTKNSPADFEKKADDLAFKMGVKKLLVRADYTTRLITLTFQIANIDLVPMDIKPNGLDIPLGLSSELDTNATESAMSKDGSVTVNKNIEIRHDFKKFPHLLIAGATGSGKSRFLHGVLYNILTSGEPVKIVPVDFKGTELTFYKQFAPAGYDFVSDVNGAKDVLDRLANEMDRRYRDYFKTDYKDLDEYNAAHAVKLPRIFLVVDEYADMMLSSKKVAETIEANVIRIAQKARAAGIHLILSTQRPTTDVISGHIKANIEGKVALRVASALDSRIVIDTDGAEKLTKGEFIYKLGDCHTGRSFIVDVGKIKAQLGVTDALVEDEDVWTNTEEESSKDNLLIGIDASKRDALEYILEISATQGVTFLSAVKTALDGFKERLYNDILTELAIKYGKASCDIDASVRATLRYLDYRGQVKRIDDPLHESTMYNASYLSSWKIVNLEYTEPEVACEIAADEKDVDPNLKYLPTKTSKTNLMDLKTESGVAEMLKYTGIARGAGCL